MKKFLLFFIIILAFFLRFYKIETVPPSLYWDEVSQGYNSYSILKTGRDEHKELFPITRFQAFGDYKAPVYIYLDVPFIALFGNTSPAVRLPSALFGTLTVFLTYFLVKELFASYKRKEMLGLLAAFFLAISPWHIQLSRTAYEANVATFFTVLGVFLFFLSLRKREYFLFSIASFVIGFYAFNAHRVFIPLLIILLFSLFYKSLLRNKTVLVANIVVGIVLLLPFVMYLRTPESKLRFNEVNIFSDLSVIKDSNTHIAEDNNSLIGKLTHNRRLVFGLLYTKHYFDFFNPSYLFFTGDENPRFSLQDNGELFLWELPCILYGLYVLMRKPSRESLFIFGWFLIAPVAAATARETPHALRSETYVPTYEIFAAFGLVFLYGKLKEFSLRIEKLVVAFGIGIVCASLFLFLHGYFVHYPVQYAGVWQYGYKQAVEKAESMKENYDYIIFTNKYGRAYVYVLFYGNVRPQDYWKEGKVTRDMYGFYNVTAFGKYQFDANLQDQKYKGKRLLYVLTPSEMSSGLKVLDTVSFLDGKPAFLIAVNK